MTVGGASKDSSNAPLLPEVDDGLSMSSSSAANIFLSSVVKKPSPRRNFTTQGPLYGAGEQPTTRGMATIMAEKKSCKTRGKEALKRATFNSGIKKKWKRMQSRALFRLSELSPREKGWTRELLLPLVKDSMLKAKMKAATTAETVHPTIVT